MNRNAKRHKLMTQDDSGVTSVVVCGCGESFIGIGPSRIAEARYAHALHRFAAFEYTFQYTQSGKAPEYPERDAA